MKDQNWVWVCTCGTIIPRESEGRHQDGGVNAHAAQHRKEVAKTATEGWGFGPFPATIVPTSAFPPPHAYEMSLTHGATGEADPRHRYVVPNPAHEAFRWHGGTPYRIEPQHRDESVPPLARIDRAIKDVEYALELVEQCQPPLPADADPEVFRQRLAQAVNLLCSAERDVDRLQDELLVTHATYDADCLRQRKYLPYEAQPMFQLDSDDGRYFSGRGSSFSGPLTIQEHLRRYGIALGEAAKEAAMALLADQSDMRQYPAESIGWTAYQMHLFGATSFADEEEGHDLETVRAIIAPDAPPLRVSVYVTQSDDDCTLASRELQEAGIRFGLRRTVISRGDPGTPHGRLTQYEIIVRQEDEQAAKTALGRD